jgi:hypothetical protein
MSHDPFHHDPDAHLSGSGYLLDELGLTVSRPFEDRVDGLPLPEDRQIDVAIADIFDALVATLTDTSLEPDLNSLLWSTVNVFHWAVERAERELDHNEAAQKRLQRDQDGSEVRSVELERALDEGQTLIERRNVMERFRDAAADQFSLHAHKPWTPRSGSKVNRKALTAAVVDSRDFINARRYADSQVLIPPGVRIALSSGTDVNDVDFIWATLDKVKEKHPEMVLLHGGNETGGERIGALWADHRGVPAVAFRPDWKKHRTAAPFKRNDRILEAMPKGVIVFAGNGIQSNLHDKARALGIAVMDFRERKGPS